MRIFIIIELICILLSPLINLRGEIKINYRTNYYGLTYTIKEYNFNGYSIIIENFSTLDLYNHINVIVKNDKEKIILFKEINKIYPYNKNIFIKKLKRGILLSYHAVYVRGTGQWTELLYLDYFTKNKESSLIVMGRDKRMLFYSKGLYDRTEQEPKIKFINEGIEIEYVYKYWKNNDRFKTIKDLISSVPTKTFIKKMIIYINNNNELDISHKSTTIDGIMDKNDLGLNYLKKFQNNPLPWRTIRYYHKSN